MACSVAGVSSPHAWCSSLPKGGVVLCQRSWIIAICRQPPCTFIQHPSSPKPRPHSPLPRLLHTRSHALSHQPNRGKKVMLDCGIHPGLQGEGSLPYLSAEDLDTIDVALITHFHLDHCAAVPYLLEKTVFKVWWSGGGGLTMPIQESSCLAAVLPCLALPRCVCHPVASL